MVPFCCATYSRPSGPNCREVGLTELAFLSKLLPKLIGVVVWAHEASARSIMTVTASTAVVISAQMPRVLVDHTGSYSFFVYLMSKCLEINLSLSLVTAL